MLKVHYGEVCNLKAWRSMPKREIKPHSQILLCNHRISNWIDFSLAISKLSSLYLLKRIPVVSPILQIFGQRKLYKSKKHTSWRLLFVQLMQNGKVHYFSAKSHISSFQNRASKLLAVKVGGLKKKSST